MGFAPIPGSFSSEVSARKPFAAGACSSRNRARMYAARSSSVLKQSYITILASCFCSGVNMLPGMSSSSLCHSAVCLFMLVAPAAAAQKGGEALLCHMHMALRCATEATASTVHDNHAFCAWTSELKVPSPMLRPAHLMATAMLASLVLGLRWQPLP